MTHTMQGVDVKEVSKLGGVETWIADGIILEGGHGKAHPEQSDF